MGALKWFGAWEVVYTLYSILHNIYYILCTIQYIVYNIDITNEHIVYRILYIGYSIL